MKEETTLLLKKTETKVEEKQKTETKTVTEKKEEKIVKELFSEKANEEVVVEKPNFDKIEELPPEKRKKIFKVEKEKVEGKKKSKKLTLILASVCLAILAAFCITTGVEIAKANQSLQAVQSEYSANLGSLIQKIYSTETGNRSLSLFETFPEEDLTASSFYQTSNWFDRFCKFLTGLFGG